MSTKSIALAAAMALSLSGAAWAQTPAGGGRTEGNMNNPGSVKSNTEKGMERSTGSATGGSMGAAGATTGTAGSTSGHSGGGNTSTGGTSGGSGAGAR
ncbi:hypothetical protein [Methylobacterium nigriterrae]|uniref:hypothetical protein n=1 Tax=Methylobacterium nigriterrae TaxID=3127512 RepID=UPI003013287D